MMAQKRLHELLREDQEPFLLKNYIAEIKRPNIPKPKPLPVTKRLRKQPIVSSQVSNFPHNFCRNACFFSFNGNNSPEPRKSPLFNFQSPIKSPCRNGHNTILLHIPARTANLLLEAALRIQKQSSLSQKTKNKNGFGLFGSLLKRLTHRAKPRKKEISGDGVKVSVKDILRWDSSVGRKKSVDGGRDNKQVKEDILIVDKSACECSCSCNGRPSSAAWSESNEGKSLEETSSSSFTTEEEELLAGNVDFVINKVINGDHIDFASFDNHFCGSPFHFILQSTPSSGNRTPDFDSPATSPRPPHNIKGKETINDVESLIKFQLNGKIQGDAGEEEEEDKEQCSPVSVLDPPFADDDDGHDDNEGEDDGLDDDDHLECSYAIVQRVKQQLLQKLCRFEKLAGLDPIELEKKMLEEEQEEDDDDEDDNDINDFNDEEEYEDAATEETGSAFCCPKKIPRDMKKLVSDLIDEEEKKQNSYTNKEATMKRVWKKLESWKEVESNTIDMMVEQDYQRELGEWKRNQEQIQDAAIEIEIGIFGLLVDELSQELMDLIDV